MKGNLAVAQREKIVYHIRGRADARAGSGNECESGTNTPR